MRRDLSRRAFLRTTSTILLPAAGSAQGCPANNRLSIAAIGTGGRGAANMEACKGENFVALCDVYEPNLEKAAKKYPDAKTYVDFRRLWDDE